MSAAALKIIIFLLIIAMIASLSGGMYFLMKDSNLPESKRTLYALGMRVTVATALVLTLGYGIYSGKLQNNAPWGDHRAQTTQQ